MADPNPYSSPATSAEPLIAAPVELPKDQIRPFRPIAASIRWMIICLVSGAPSFAVAFSMGEHYLLRSMAMVAGILTFVAIYVAVESTVWVRQKLTDRRLRIAVIIGYATRIGISVLFPIGLMLDMLCGAMSVGLMSSLFSIDGLGSYGSAPGELFGLVLWFYGTTLVQGVILNCVLAGYTLVVYGIVLVCTANRRSP